MINLPKHLQPIIFSAILMILISLVSLVFSSSFAESLAISFVPTVVITIVFGQHIERYLRSKALDRNIYNALKYDYENAFKVLEKHVKESDCEKCAGYNNCVMREVVLNKKYEHLKNN